MQGQGNALTPRRQHREEGVVIDVVSIGLKSRVGHLRAAANRSARQAGHYEQGRQRNADEQKAPLGGLGSASHVLTLALHEIAPLPFSRGFPFLESHIRHSKGLNRC